MPQIMRDFIDKIILNLPDEVVRIMLVIVALVLFYVLRRGLIAVMQRPIRALLTRTKAEQIERIIEALGFPIQLVIIATALALSLAILDPPDTQAADFVVDLTRSLVIVAASLSLFRMVDIFSLDHRLLESIIGFDVEDRLVPLLRTALKIVVLFVTVVIVMNEWSIDISGLVASLGIVGLAFSLAAQDTVSNLFGFSTIVGDRTFLVGEYIRSGDIEGVVLSVGIRSTRILKPDRGVLSVPNSMLANQPVQRFVRRRIEFTLGVTYETTAEQMETLLAHLREMLKQREKIIPSSVAVYFTSFGNSSLDITVLADVTIRDWRGLLEEREQVNLAVMRIVQTMGLSIAFPTRSIYIEGIPKNLSLRPPSDVDVPASGADAMQ